MAEVIDFSSLARIKRQGVKNQGDDLTAFLMAAVKARPELERLKDTVAVVNFAGLRRLFEARLADLILKGKNIGADFFLCGNYVAGLLTDVGKGSPESWFAVDFLVKGVNEDSPTALRDGANLCFLLCAVFPARANFRCMKAENYESIGCGLFYGYYSQTGLPVAYYMSRQFKPMVKITKECLNNL